MDTLFNIHLQKKKKKKKTKPAERFSLVALRSPAGDLESAVKKKKDQRRQAGIILA